MKKRSAAEIGKSAPHLLYYGDESGRSALIGFFHGLTWERLGRAFFVWVDPRASGERGRSYWTKT